MTDFSHLHDDDLDAVMGQIARDAFKAKDADSRARIAADFRAALDEQTRRALTTYRAAVAAVAAN